MKGFGVVQMVQACLPNLRPCEGRIINIGGVSSIEVNDLFDGNHS